jgi:hypothetical protein
VGDEDMTVETIEGLDNQIQVVTSQIKAIEAELEKHKVMRYDLRRKRLDLFLAQKSAEFGFELTPNLEVRCTEEMHEYALTAKPNRPDIVNDRFYVGAVLELESIEEDGIHLWSGGGAIPFPPDMVKRAVK